MPRFMPYLGIMVAVFVGVFITALSSSVTVSRTPTITAHTASSTLSVLPGFSLPPLLPTSFGSGASVATTAPARATAASKKKTAAPSTSAVPAPSALKPVFAPAPPTSSGNVALDVSASALRRALVNVICYVPAGSGLHSMSGSGVIVDPKGIILTNAHVAQYFLLADRGVSCTVRAGSPATDSYEAALAYISPAWVRTNANAIIEAAPSGTGEYDFALLAVEKSATAAALPAIFPSLPLAQVPPSFGTPVVIASYGAQFLETNQIQSSLFPTIVFGSVKDVFTFATSTIDVLALGGSAAAQEGSSGGGVADVAGTLIGTITTSTIQGATSARSLNAITASYIRSAYASETGGNLDQLLAKPTQAAITDFASQIPALESILTAHLP